ncbi:acyl-CoA thioester hydrolase [Roseivivax lentus]|uniref:Acyl-CoA thioester hydrolase n=1 Tax=Roseivivax lentus TaxID=633194 RepID=A0A1N7NIB6_9RHOB|nr:thioesterase family protein [Roseivivax lentus]SIS98135.1 acyl-CoA thioester hydrolase [Roseivivax lentus]
MPRTPPPDRAGFPAFVDLQTRWNDNDEYGHLNNATYLELFDTAMSYWQIENGITIRGPDAWRFVVVESGCTYFREVGFPDRLAAGLRVARLGGSSFRIEIGLFRAGEDEAASLGFFVNVLTGADGRPTPIPDDLRARLSRIAV